MKTNERSAADSRKMKEDGGEGTTKTDRQLRVWKPQVGRIRAQDNRERGSGPGEGEESQVNHDGD